MKFEMNHLGNVFRYSTQNTNCLPQQQQIIIIYETMILQLVLCDCKMWSLFVFKIQVHEK